MYVKALKSTPYTPKDGALDSWLPSAGNFSITAANGHPYGVTTCCVPTLPGNPLHNGEHEEGVRMQLRDSEGLHGFNLYLVGFYARSIHRTI
jgi:hypothetical protein